MKVIKSIGLFFVYPAVMFVLGGFSFLYLETYFYPGTAPEYEQAAVEEEQVLTSDTKYVIIESDLKKGTSVETEWNVPEQYIGMDRDAFIDAMMQYEANPPLGDLNRGFVSVEVKSFSDEKVVLRKNYLYEEPKNHFYLSAQNNYIVVLCEDLTTVYLNTTIRLDSLPERIQEEIMLNKYMENETDLYNFLETYSS